MKKKLLTISLLSASLALSASATVIDFTASQGYTDGTLYQQTVNTATGSTITWDSASANVQNAYQVDTTNGWVQYSSPATGANNNNIAHQNFTSEFLGFDPLNPLRYVDFTISLDWVQQGSIGDNNNLQFRLLAPNGQRYGHIQLEGDGQVRGNGGSNVLLADISEVSGFSDFTMRIDTVDESLSFLVNGAAVAGANNIAYSQSPNGEIGRMQFAQNFSDTTTPFQVRIGSLEMAQIPEPSAYAALAGIAVLGLAIVRRRRK